MAKIEDLGISYVYSIIAKMGFLFREQTKHDYGIDIQFETTTEAEKGSGRLIAAQIKSGVSYFKTQTENEITFYADEYHIKYWAEHDLPILLILYNPDTDLAFWCDVKEYISKNPQLLMGAPYHIHVPKTNLFDVSIKDIVEEIALHRSDRLSLERKWYDLISYDDNSVGQAKRYSAEILVGPDTGKSAIRLAVFQATKYLQTLVEHASERQEKYWGNQAPHVVTLFVYREYSDKVQHNWIARSRWIDPNRPNINLIGWKNATDTVEDIIIEFQSDEKYWAWKNHISSEMYTKSEYIKHMSKWITVADQIVNEVTVLYGSWANKSLDKDAFDTQLLEAEKRYNVVLNEYDTRKMWPPECSDAANSFAGVIGTGHNLFIVSKNFVEGKRDKKNYDQVFHIYIQQYSKDRKMFDFELKKLGR